MTTSIYYVLVLSFLLSIVSVDCRPREVPPDIQLVTPRRNNTNIVEETKDGITYKRVDVTDDIIQTGLNRNIYLTSYLENATANDFRLVVRDLTPLYPFQYSLGNNRSVLFVVDNDRLVAHFNRERRALLRIAANVNRHDDRKMHNFLYRLGGALDDTESLRHAFMRKILRALSRNRVSPVEMTIDELEKELADAAVIEFSLRQLDQESFAKSPMMIKHRQMLAEREAREKIEGTTTEMPTFRSRPEFIEVDGIRINVTELSQLLREQS